MARVKISEFRAKKMLLGDAYKGISIRPEAGAIPATGKWVAKVDQGVKKRAKQGLVSMGGKSALAKAINGWKKKGFSQFIVEPFVVHKPEEERYLSLERVRNGIRVLYAKEGGIEIETHPESVQTFIIRDSKDVVDVAKKTGIPQTFFEKLVEMFNRDFFAFLEINPLVVQKGNAIPLDAAGLVDSTASFFVKNSWTDADLVRPGAKHIREKHVEALAATTPAALSLRVLNKDGSIFFLLSGGGGSVVIADEASLRLPSSAIGNYGEYSGGPTREETYLYAKEIIELMLVSKSKKKALVIAGGVANFTDIKQTFAGIIDALSETAARLRQAKIKVFVRRGGPNEKAGLAAMEAFLKKERLFGSVYGSDAVITQAIEEATEYVQAPGGR